jgi:pyruvate formate lyase activating enzyme
MCDAINSRYISKRDFIRYCAMGIGGLVIGSGRLEAMAESLVRGKARLPQDDGPGKWSKEALFYERTEAGLRCLKCPNACVLGPNESGICRNRVNYGGKLYSIAYGNPCAVHIDPIEKKPLFHFLPSTRAFSIATAGCSLRCLNCQNFQISQVSPKDTDNSDLMPDGVVDQCTASHCESIAYTYSEPTTFYEYALDTAKLARGKKVKNVLKSSGYVNEEPLRKLAKYLDAANIDLKCFDDGIYRKLSEGQLAPILRTLKVLKEEGVWLEITNLLIPSWTDDLDMVKRMCEWLCSNGLSDSPLHFTRFIPLYKLTQLPTTPVSIMEKARESALKAGVKFVYLGNIPGHEAENTYCPKCAKMIVERRGYTIVANHIVKDKCAFCHEHIPGVWS